MISVCAINPLAGLDQLLHGADNLKGWGQPNRADPTLRYVTGFDPVAKRFIYTVNDRFGDNPASRVAILTPQQWNKLPDDVRNPTLQRGFQRRGAPRP
jgi:hypothetical protein